MISSIFLSTLSLRRATVRRATGTAGSLAISIHALLAESDGGGWGSAPDWRISIHALLAESDGWWSVDVPGWILGISIHALLAESDQTSLVVIGTNCVISIHALLAESDLAKTKIPPKVKNFYPRSPCGERHASATSTGAFTIISIHALLAESDCEPKP